MTTTINHRFFFPHSPEKVWEYLTNSELMEQWLMKTDFHPVVGSDFQFFGKPVAALHFDGIIYCRVLELVPFKKLSYSWKLGPGDGKITLDSTVVWTLHPKDNGTELFLDHTGSPNLETFPIFNAMNDGWLANINKIAQNLSAKSHGTTKA